MSERLAAQLAHLAGVARLPNVTIQVVPNIAQAGLLALRLPSPESVVAWFVTGSGNSVWLPEVRNEAMTQRPSSPVVGDDGLHDLAVFSLLDDEL